MSAAPKYEVTYDDGSSVVAAGKASDWLKFERHFKVPVGDAAAKPFLEHIWFMAYLASTRGEDIAFDDWCDKVADVSPQGDDDVPLEKGP